MCSCAHHECKHWLYLIIISLALAKSSSSSGCIGEQASGHWSHWSDEVIQVGWKLFSQHPFSLTELADVSESHAAAAATAALGVYGLPDLTPL